MKAIIGCDEAGRGPLAGPLVIAAVYFPKRIHLKGLNDSKRLSENRRLELYELIKLKTQYSVITIGNVEIDKIGLARCLKWGFKEAIESLVKLVDAKSIEVLIDGNTTFGIKGHPIIPIVRGDSKIRQIMAASILAKVTRDEIMKELSYEFPKYSFERHKGYGTKTHIEAITKFGYTRLHRRSFKLKDAKQENTDSR